MKSPHRLVSFKRSLTTTIQLCRKFIEDPLYDPRVVHLSGPMNETFTHKSKFQIFENPKKMENYDCSTIQNESDKKDFEGKLKQQFLLVI